MATGIIVPVAGAAQGRKGRNSAMPESGAADGTRRQRADDSRMQTRHIKAWLTGARGQRLALGATLVLLGALAWQLSQLTWLLIPEPTADDVRSTTQPVATPVSRAPDRDYSRIAQWHLMGKADAVPEARPEPSVPVDAPETRLNLVLRGVLASGSKALARAIIAEDRGEEKMYKVGDRLPGNAELVEILSDRVILRRGGRHETLRLPRENLEDTAPAGGSGYRRRTASAAGNADAGAILSRYRQQLRSNPRSLIELVRPIPETRNNRFNGFRLFPGSKPELFRKLGLRPGDLVTEVNGIPLDSPSRGVQVLQDLKDADEIRLHIRRGRRELDLSFRLS
ncbi:MAG TPA: type II secretion system protein GspC [Thiotrichales bacterium]|nr:type II secretion system protein GspC [Thiotrichales bacterium]